MALVVANVTFEHAGMQVLKGTVIDTTEYLYVMFPSRFTGVTDVTLGGTTIITGLGTVAPGTVGRLWNNGGTVMVG